jgi:copper chaperone NosL
MITRRALLLSPLLASAGLLGCKDLKPLPAAPSSTGSTGVGLRTGVRTRNTPPARQAPDADGTFHVSEGDLCPVTGRPIPASSPWTAAVTLRDGRAYYLLSPRALARGYLHAREAFRVEQSAIVRLLVTDYTSGKPIDARRAYFLLGTKVIGPRGPDLIVVDSDEGAKRLQREREGRVLRLSDLTRDLLRTMR